MLPGSILSLAAVVCLLPALALEQLSSEEEESSQSLTKDVPDQSESGGKQAQSTEAPTTATKGCTANDSGSGPLTPSAPTWAEEGPFIRPEDLPFSPYRAAQSLKKPIVIKVSKAKAQASGSSDDPAGAVNCSRNLCAFFSQCEKFEGVTDCYCYPCPAQNTSMCGSDGATYSNLCEMQRASCLYSRFIQPLYLGPCSKPLFALTVPDFCLEVTHAPCLPHQACVITDDDKFRCICHTYCSEVFEPVCATNGKNYPNACSLGVEVCLTGKPIFVAHKGTCSLEKTFVISSDKILRNASCSATQECEGVEPCPPSVSCDD